MPAAPRTVAIVDDDAELLKGLERLLNAHGLGTRAFPSAEAFLATEFRDGDRLRASGRAPGRDVRHRAAARAVRRRVAAARDLHDRV